MPALATLGIVTLAASALAYLATARTVGAAPRAVQMHALVTGIVAAVFWAWAVANCVHRKSFDLGAVSFLTVLASSLAQYHKATAYGTMGSQRCYTCCSCGFVTLNYTLGLVLVGAESLRLYFAVAAAAWLVAAVLGVHVCQRAETARSLSSESERQQRMPLSS